MATPAEQLPAQTSQQPLILQYLERYKSQIALALPKHLNPDRMARIVTTEVRKTPALLECSPKSLFGAVIQASQLGLEPGSALGHCYLLPFRNRKQKARDVQLIIGYRGMIDLARRSGQVISIVARAVYEADTFTYAYGLEDTLEHAPFEGKDRGALTHVYAIAKLKGGGVQWEVMTRAEVDAIRAQSKAADSGPWVTHYDEMAKKTVVRRLFKFLPVSVEIQTAVGLDEQADAGVDQRNDALIEGDFMVLDETQEPPANTGTKNLKSKLKCENGDDPAPEPQEHDAPKPREDGATEAPEPGHGGATAEQDTTELELDGGQHGFDVGDYTGSAGTTQLLAEVEQATTPEALDLIRDLNKSRNAAPPDKSEVTKAINKRFAELAE